MAFTVVMTSRAARDVEAIHDYIASRSVSGADRWFEAFVHARDSLQGNPERHALAPESGAYASELRQAFFRTTKGNRYRIVYTVIDQQVLVMHVRGQGQNLIE